MPAATASRRIEYSSLETVGYDPPPDQDRARSWPPPWRGNGDIFLVRGKFSHRLRDLVGVRHEELLLRGVEGHRRDVRRRDPHHRAVEVTESVLRDDRGYLGAETSGQVVLVHDHALPGFTHRCQDRVPVERRQRAEVDHLHAHTFRLQMRRRLQAVVGHEAPGEAAQVGALAAHHGGTDRDEVVAVGDLFGDEAVDLLVLEKEHRVGVTDGRLEEPMRVRGHARHHDLQAWNVRVESLDRLRVIEPAVDSPAEGRADDYGDCPVAVGPVAGSRRLAHDLVEGGMDEIRELDLSDRDQAVQGGADRDADNGRLRQRRIEHARLAEARVETVRRPEHPALPANVLAHDEHTVVALHLFADPSAHRLYHPHFGLKFIVQRNINQG